MGEIKCRLLMVSVLYSVWLQQHSLDFILIYTFIYHIGCIFLNKTCSRLIWKTQQQKQYSTVFPADAVKLRC